MNANIYNVFLMWTFYEFHVPLSRPYYWPSSIINPSCLYWHLQQTELHVHQCDIQYIYGMIDAIETEHDDVMTWKRFPLLCEKSMGHWWVFSGPVQAMRRMHGSQVGFLRASSAKLWLVYSFMLAWTSCWTNNRFADDLMPDGSCVMSL